MAQALSMLRIACDEVLPAAAAPRMSTNHFDSKRFDGEPHFPECAKITTVAPCTFETQQEMNSEHYGLHHLGFLKLWRLEALPKTKLHQLDEYSGQQHT
jgi:hypothetical protein